MDLPTALRVLDLAELPDSATAKTAYRRALRRAHPDLNEGAAAARTHAVVEAWSVIRVRLDAPEGQHRSAAQTSADRHRATSPPSPPPAAVRNIFVLGNDAIAVEAARDEAAETVMDALSTIGEMTYVDDRLGIFECIVEFVDEPTCSVVCTLQGRSATAVVPNGFTEVMVSAEALQATEQAPPLAAITQLLVRTMREVA